MSVHIGEKIKQRATELRIGPTELGKLIFTSKQNVSGIYKRKSIDVGALHKISQALNYDFFQYYRIESNSNSALPSDMAKEDASIYKKLDKKSVAKMMNDLQQKQIDLQKMIRQKDLEIITMQKKIISLLEKKGKA